MGVYVCVCVCVSAAVADAATQQAMDEEEDSVQGTWRFGAYVFHVLIVR